MRQVRQLNSRAPAGGRTARTAAVARPVATPGTVDNAGRRGRGTRPWCATGAVSRFARRVWAAIGQPDGWPIAERGDEPVRCRAERHRDPAASGCGTGRADHLRPAQERHSGHPAVAIGQPDRPVRPAHVRGRRCHLDLTWSAPGHRPRRHRYPPRLWRRRPRHRRPDRHPRYGGRDDRTCAVDRRGVHRRRRRRCDREGLRLPGLLRGRDTDSVAGSALRLAGGTGSARSAAPPASRSTHASPRLDWPPPTRCSARSATGHATPR